MSQIFTARASSWGRLFDCAYAWEGEHMLGIRKPAGLRAHLGTSIHASTAAYDSSRLPGGSPISVDDAAGVLVDTLRMPDRDVDYDQDGLSVNDAETIGLRLTAAYCHEIAPRFTYVAVEAKLKPLDIDCGGGVLVRLTGSMDRARVAATPEGIVIPDVKTGTRVISERKVSIKGRAPQLGTYQLMYEQDTGQATSGSQILGLKTSTKPEWGVSPVFDAKRVMLGTDTAPGLIEIAGQMFRSGLFPPNPSSHLCSPKYCARWSTCHFHE